MASRRRALVNNLVFRADVQCMWGKRKRVGVVTTTLVALGIGLLVLGMSGAWWFDHHSGLGAQPGTPAQRAAAQLMITSLSTPDGATRDPYGSACQIPAAYCVISTSLSPEALTTQVVLLLKSAGAHQSHRKCRERDVSGLFRCVADLSYRGGGFSLWSGIGFDIGPPATPTVETPTWLRLDASPLDAPAKPIKPLGPWRTASPLPTGWPAASCQASSPLGCYRYGTTSLAEESVPGTPQSAYEAATASLKAHGYVLARARACRTATATSAASCLIAGERFRTIGARDHVRVTVLIKAAGASRVTVQVNMAADAL